MAPINAIMQLICSGYDVATLVYWLECDYLFNSKSQFVSLSKVKLESQFVSSSHKTESD